MAETPKSLREIFDEAAELPAGERRRAYLDQACGRDAALRANVEELLRAEETAGGFLADPKRETMLVNVAATEQEGDRIGRYKLLQKIGEGGCGSVYMAEQTEPVKRRVALKIIKLGMDTRAVVARFEAERQALALMDHPCVARVLDAGATDTGRPYFVMELVRGIKITDYCDQNRLSTPARLQLFIQVCQAVQHAHQKGIIHRDLKPSNILVTSNDGVPLPKVIDFGIAKATADIQLTDKTLFTRFEMFIGTPAYMSPEQAEFNASDIDTRTDIYALGVLLYELLTGLTPFDAKELMSQGIDALRRAIRDQEPPKPSTRLTMELSAAETGRGQSTHGLAVPTQEESEAEDHRRQRLREQIAVLRGDLDWIVLKAIEKDRTRRYETASALAMDIQRHMNCEPVLACPPSKLYEFQKTVRRHKVGFGATAAIIMVLAAGLALTSWQATVATRARKAESVQRIAADSAREQALAAEKLAETARANEAEMRRVAEARVYAVDMNLAQQALAADNLGLATELLDRHRPEPGQPDRRGWEWRYLWRQSRSDALYTLCQQSNRIEGLAVSHDGKWLAVEAHGEVSVWNLVSRRELTRFKDKRSVAFSPVRPVLAMWTPVYPQSPEQHYRPAFWDAETGRFVPDPPSPDSTKSAWLRGLAFTPDGQRLVTASVQWSTDPNQLTHWRMSDGKKLATYPIQVRGPGVGMPVSTARDTNLVALAEESHWIRVIEVNSGSEKFKTQSPGKGWLEAVALSGDGRTLAACSGTDETTIRLWDVPSGRELGVLEGPRAYVIALVFWPDGKTLASAGADQTIRIWDVAEKRALAVLRGHKDEVHRLALLPDNSTLISGARDGTVMVWDTTRMRSKKSIVTLPSPVTGFWAPAKDGDAILTIQDQGWLTRWSGPDFHQPEPLLQISSHPHGVCLSVDQRLLATGTDSGLIKLWDVHQRKLSREMPISTGPISPLAFLADDTRLAVWIEGQESLAVYDLAAGRQLSSWSASGDQMRGIVISPDGRWCLADAANGTALLRELSSGREAGPPVPAPGRQRAAFSPDGGQLAIPFDSGLVRRWEVPSLRERAPLERLLRAAHSLAFSPDGRRLAVGSGADESLKVWDSESGLPMVTLPGEGGPCWETKFSPDGSILATRHELGMLDIWRVPTWAEIAAAEAKE